MNEGETLIFVHVIVFYYPNLLHFDFFALEYYYINWVVTYCLYDVVYLSCVFILISYNLLYANH